MWNILPEQVGLEGEGAQSFYLGSISYCIQTFLLSAASGSTISNLAANLVTECPDPSVLEIRETDMTFVIK
jgi:hypothetical protein